MRCKGRAGGPSLPDLKHRPCRTGAKRSGAAKIAPAETAGTGLLAASLRASARALEAEQDRWFLWLPVLFAGGIISYFTLADEPGARLAIALLLGAIGLCLAAKHAPLGLCIGGAALAFASGFAAAKLRTEMARAPVLSHELRYVKATGFVEAHELRDKGTRPDHFAGALPGRSKV